MSKHVLGVVAETVEKLESSALKEIKWMMMVKDELKTIYDTLIAINRILLSAQEKQSKNMAFRERLEELKSIVLDIGNEIDLILAQHALSLKVKENGSGATLYHRFPGSRKAWKFKELGQRLDEVHHNWKQMNLQEQQATQVNLQEQQPTIPHPQGSLRNVAWLFAKALMEKENRDKAWREARRGAREAILRIDEDNYKRSLEEDESGRPKYVARDEYELYRMQNCRLGDTRRR